MKALIITSLCFKLPDDFQGGLADALRLMADYHESAEARFGSQVQVAGKSDKVDDLIEIPLGLAMAKTFDMFVDEVASGKRLVGSLQFVNHIPTDLNYAS